MDPGILYASWFTPQQSYIVSVLAPGFKKAVNPPVTITVKAQLRLDVALEIGDAGQTVELEATNQRLARLRVPSLKQPLHWKGGKLAPAEHVLYVERQ